MTHKNFVNVNVTVDLHVFDTMILNPSLTLGVFLFIKFHAASDQLVARFIITTQTID